MQLTSKGITLIEILVTLSISVIGIVGLSTLQIQTHRAIGDSGNRSQAIWMMEDITNRIHLNRTAATDYNGDHASLCNSAPAKVCSPYYNGSALVVSESCSGKEMAAWDLYEVLCGMDATVDTSVVTKSSPNTFIANPALNAVVDSTNNDETTLTLTWDSRTEAAKSDGKKIYITDEKLLGSPTGIVRRASLETVFIP